MTCSVRTPCARFLLAAASALAAAAAPAYDWLQFNGDSRHSGNNTQETRLGASNVAALTLLFQATLPSIADGAPAVLTSVATPVGTRDLLFVTTQAGHLIALDARTGVEIWSKQYPAGTCRVNSGSLECYTTSSPAVDPNRLFVYGYGLDGYVHKFQVGDGTEIRTGGWPELATLKPFDEKGSSALTIATAASGTSYLYVTNGGYPGDAGDYQGHVTAINLADGTQRVFNTLCSNNPVHFVHSPGTPDCDQAQAAIWARAGVVYDPVTDRIYMATGNGLYDGNTGGFDWGDSVFSLAPDGTGSGGKPLDSYTPGSYALLQASDLDLGSTAPAILPAPGFAGRLAVQSGKDSLLRLIDLENLSRAGGPGHVGGEWYLLAVPQGGEVLSALAVWTNPADGSTWTFVANANGISALKLTVDGSGFPALARQWHTLQGGFSPLIANGVLYYAGTGFLRALDPTTGNLLWSNTTLIGGIHWESPVVANGILYLTDESSHLTAFAVGPMPSSVSPAFGPAAGGTLFTILGNLFQASATVTFGGAAATGVTATENAITGSTPAGAGTVDVVVRNPDAFTGTLPAAYTYASASFFTLAPCRVADTRNLAGPYGAPALASNADRALTLAGQCGIPSSARAVSINLTVTQATAAGDFRIFPGGGPLPNSSALNYGAGQTRASNAVVALGSAGDVVVHCDQPSGTAQLVVDVSGYFQ